MSTDNSVNLQSRRFVAKSAGIIGIATLCSRILGFIRDMIIARMFGILIYAQAFVVAFKIPNLLRDSVGEGAANAAFVPVFSEYVATRKKEDFWALVNVVLTVLIVVVSIITLLGIILSPFLVRIMAPGFMATPEKLAVTIKLNRIIFPYILLISLTAFCMSVLNTLRHFSVPAFASCLLNISIITCALIWGEGIKGLASGVLIGGVLQLAVQIPVLYKKGFRFRPAKEFNHPALKTISRLMLPRVFSSCIYQLNNFVDSIFGSWGAVVGEGGVAVLYYAYRLILFPVGIFSNSLSQAILPTMSTQALDGTSEKLKQTLSWGLRAIFFVLLPSSVGFVALSYPIIRALFGGGKFDAASCQITASTLLYYSFGMFAYGGTKILQSCFFALKDTLTPAKIALIALVANIVLNAVFMFPFKVAGIALATSISGIMTFLMLFSILKKRMGDFGTGEIIFSFVRILLASLCMGTVCFLAVRYSDKYMETNFCHLVRLVLLLGLGAASYLLFCFVFRVAEMQQLWQWLSRKNKGTVPA